MLAPIKCHLIVNLWRLRLAGSHAVAFVGVAVLYIFVLMATGFCQYRAIAQNVCKKWKDWYHRYTGV